MVYDLYESLYKHNNQDIAYTLEDLANLAHAIKTNSKSVTRQIESLIEEKADRYNLCPECFNELSTVVTYENSEYFGRTVNEDIKKSKCNHCGWKED